MGAAGGREGDIAEAVGTLFGGGHGGRITVKLWAGEYKAFVEIIDQGRGIPPEALGSVKGKFFKGSNAVRGSGIGLALVDSIMTALDGTLDLRSTLGKGTVVTLGLPLYKKL